MLNAYDWFIIYATVVVCKELYLKKDTSDQDMKVEGRFH